MALTEQRKSCSKCGEMKALPSFYKRKRAPDGHEAECKECRKQRNGKWFLENKDRHHEMMRGWYQQNRDYHIEKTKERYEADKPAALARYYKRDARTKIATPKWANLKKIAEYYRIAAQQTKSTGVKWEIDHIVPLQSDRVCGLHVEHNLSFTRAEYNRRKSNRYWPNMPEGEPAWL